MRKCLILAGFALLGFLANPLLASAPIDARVDELLARMTLEEKVGQLVQRTSPGELTGPASSSPLAPQFTSGGIGSMLNVVGVVEARKWQKLAVESSRLHIPLLFGLDVVHGYRTIFPIPLAGAASWDLPRIERSEHIAASEASACGINWTFAPMVDIARDPRWGRIAEGAGEDPFLGSAIARARVHGFQGDGLFATPENILACAKHFAAYGAAQAGRDYFTTDISERTLREVYLPPFRAAVDAGVATLMAAFNDLDGTPCSASSLLLDRVLRQEWGFRGFVVSDWQGIDELRAHGFASDLTDASRRSMLAGLDVDMESQGYAEHLAELVRAGRVPVARVDAAVRAVLAAKFRLGLFDDPYRYCDASREKVGPLQPAYLEAARDLARRSAVLLKNNGVLPLKKTGLTVALVGPLADAPFHQLGTWHTQGRIQDTVTVRTALAELFPGAHLRYAPGCAVQGSDTSGFAAAREAAAGADVVIAVLGEDADQSGESTSRADLNLSGPQAALLGELKAFGKPVVLLLLTGRPLTITSVESLADAILVAWHPGTMGGPAIGDLLTGAYNPSGHLPVTWPRSVGQIPLFYAHKNSGRPAPLETGDRYFSHYIDDANTPLYPFGFGLSYTAFTYDQLRLSEPVLREGGEPLTVKVQVRNTGHVAGETVVQLYVRDRVGSVTRPVRELKGFSKIDLAPGEEKNVEFKLTAADLAFWRADMTFGPEPGEYDVFVGGDSDATLTAKFTLQPAGTTPR